MKHWNSSEVRWVYDNDKEREEDNNSRGDCPECGMPYEGTSCGDIDSYRCNCAETGHPYRKDEDD
jgi:hypothetical protein